MWIFLFVAFSGYSQDKEDVFQKYLSCFTEWRDLKITDSIFARPDGDIPKDVLLKVIPFRANDDHAMQENHDSLALVSGLAWLNAGYRIISPNYIAMFALSVTDCNNQMIIDRKLYTFTKEGNFIDSLTCGRCTQAMCETEEPQYFFRITSSNSNTSFRATQYVSIDSCDMDKGEERWKATDYEICILLNGKISKTIERTYSTLVYGNARNQYPDSIFVGNKTLPLEEDWLVVPVEITYEEFDKLSKHSVNLQAKPISPDGIYVGEENQDCDFFASMVFYAFGKPNQAMKPLFRYEDRRFFSECGLKMYWINSRELAVAGYSVGNGINWGDYVTKGLKPRNTPVYYKLKLICLPGSYLQSVLPKNLQRDETGIEIAEQQIKSFYQKYMSMITYGKVDYEQLFSLKKSIFTPQGLRKCGRLSLKADADALLNAQDSNEKAVNTVICTHLSGDWYQVSYLWNHMQPRIRINLKLQYDKFAKKFLICDLRPL